MSSGTDASSTFDSASTTGRALGAFFGMVGFNLVLVVIALVLRRVTRPKDTTTNNEVELKNGKYNRKTSNSKEDVEMGHGATETTLGGAESEKHLQKVERQNAEASPSGHHDNGGFVDVDLGNNEVKEKTDPVYESRNKSESANINNEYSNLEEVNVRVESDVKDADGDYENFQAGKSTTENSETGICY